MPWLPNDWHRVVRDARWTRAERIAGKRFRCGVCRQDFGAGADGAPTFIDQHYSMRLTVCHACEILLDTLKPLGSP